MQNERAPVDRQSNKWRRGKGVAVTCTKTAIQYWLLLEERDQHAGGRHGRSLSAYNIVIIVS